ncbi:arginase family protein [Salininema proteolyticum]|uniref:Arginase family protein n=1 Tax=Salininema proteolyticum TaxID=1607685 RepID=A0ABV8TV50_9ACTN
MQRSIAILDAPSNLGLRPPEEGSVPGCHKAPGVLRDLGIVRRLEAEDAGVLTAPRYRPHRESGRVRNEGAIADYSAALADRLGPMLDDGSFPLVLGGDCSIVLGIALALKRRGRHGMAVLDGLDYRHPGNSEAYGSVGGENLALATGLGGALTDLEGARPYLRPEDVAVAGLRPDDEFAEEAAAAGILLVESGAVNSDPVGAAERVLDTVARDGVDGFWIHLDADVLDPSVMPAVDTPEPGGSYPPETAAHLARLIASPAALGMDVAIYDPDSDGDLSAGRVLCDLVVEAFDLARGPLPQ